MWAFLLANYNKLAIMFVCVLIVGKILLTVLFIRKYERTVIGIVSSIFVWHSLVDRDMAESGLERFVMGLQNIMTVFIYAISAVLIFVKLLIG